MDDFKLNHLLKYSQSIEDRERLALSMAQQKTLAAQTSLNKLKNDLEQTRQNILKSWRVKNVNIQLIQLQSQYQENLSHELSQAQQELTKLEQRQEQQRLKLVAASQKVKTIEHLLDKYQQAKTARLQKLERNLLDEIATNRFIYSGQSKITSVSETNNKN